MAAQSLLSFNLCGHEPKAFWEATRKTHTDERDWRPSLIELLTFVKVCLCELWRPLRQPQYRQTVAGA